MVKETEQKLYNAIDFLEGALNDLCRQPGAPGQGKISRAKDLIRDAIAHERKVTDGN